MNVKALKLAIAKLPDDMEVMITPQGGYTTVEEVESVKCFVDCIGIEKNERSGNYKSTAAQQYLGIKTAKRWDKIHRVPIL